MWCVASRLCFPSRQLRETLSSVHQVKNKCVCSVLWESDRSWVSVWSSHDTARISLICSLCSLILPPKHRTLLEVYNPLPPAPRNQPYPLLVPCLYGTNAYCSISSVLSDKIASFSDHSLFTLYSSLVGVGVGVGVSLKLMQSSSWVKRFSSRSPRPIRVWVGENESSEFGWSSIWIIMRLCLVCFLVVVWKS